MGPQQVQDGRQLTAPEGTGPVIGDAGQFGGVNRLRLGVIDMGESHTGSVGGVIAVVDVEGKEHGLAAAAPQTR